MAEGRRPPFTASDLPFWLSDDGLALLSGWKRQGLTDREIARRMGMKSAAMLQSIADGHSPIRKALNADPEADGFRAEAALLARCVGFTYKEERREETDKGAWKTVTTWKYALPDVAALKFYLQSRFPDRWKDSGGEDGPEDGDEGAGVILLGSVEESGGDDDGGDGDD